MELSDAMRLELRPQVVDDVRVGERPGVRRLGPPVLNALLDHADRGPEHCVAQTERMRSTGQHEEVEHEGIEDPLGHRVVPALGERGHGLGGGAENHPVLGVRLRSPGFDRTPAQLGEEPVEVEARRRRAPVRHQGRDGGLATTRRPGQEEDFARGDHV